MGVGEEEVEGTREGRQAGRPFAPYMLGEEA